MPFHQAAPLCPPQHGAASYADAAALFAQANEVLHGVNESHAVWDELRTDYALALSWLRRLNDAEHVFQQQLHTFQRRRRPAHDPA